MPAALSAATSSARFSSAFAITRSGPRDRTRSTSGHLVPPTRATSRSDGWVHQSVAPTSSPGPVAATASVRDGTRLTTRRGGAPVNGVPRSSRGSRGTASDVGHADAGVHLVAAGVPHHGGGERPPLAGGGPPGRGGPPPAPPPGPPRPPHR